MDFRSGSIVVEFNAIFDDTDSEVNTADFTNALADNLASVLPEGASFDRSSLQVESKSMRTDVFFSIKKINTTYTVQ